MVKHLSAVLTERCEDDVTLFRRPRESKNQYVIVRPGLVNFRVVDSYAIGRTKEDVSEMTFNRCWSRCCER